MKLWLMRLAEDIEQPAHPRSLIRAFSVVRQEYKHLQADSEDFLQTHHENIPI